MKKNPFSHLVNHKILHKIGKQWVTISVGLVMLLSGATMLNSHPVHASANVAQKTPVATKQINLKRLKTIQKPVATVPKVQLRIKTNVKPLNTSINAKPVSLKQINVKAQNLHQKILNHIPKFDVHTATKTEAKSNRKVTLMISKPKVSHESYGRVITLAHHGRKHYRSYRHYKRPRYHTYRNYGHSWINLNHNGEVHAIPYGKLGYFEHGNGDMYPNYFSDLYFSPSYVKILDKETIQGYHFYRSHVPLTNKTYWILAHNFSHRKYRKASTNYFHNFLVKADHHFLKKHLNRHDRDHIYRVRSRFFYLIHHENQANAGRNMRSFRKHVIDWINFYRCYIYGENPVYENSNFDATAQNGADTQSDPEDMNWGDSDPYTIVRSYITDAADADHDGKTGHRDSVLNPAAGNVGVGQNNDVNGLFFDWGDSYSYSDNQNIDYPRISDFPIDLATDGEYWSMQSDSLGNSNGDNVEAYDITRRHHPRRLGAYDCTLSGNSTYFKVPTRKLHTGHVYKVVLNCSDYYHPYWYEFTLYDIDPYSGDIMSV